MFLVLAGFGVGAKPTLAEDPSAWLHLHSEPGDPVGQGLDYSYERPYAKVAAHSALGGNFLYIEVEASTGEQWILAFTAPEGQQLHVGEYTDVRRHPSEWPGTHPTMSVGPTGGSCALISGTFSLQELEYGADGRVQRLHLTFQQYCDESPAALTGELVYLPQPPLPPLQLAVAVDGVGTVSPAGVVRVSGTITCNQYVWATGYLTVSQGDAFALDTVPGVTCTPQAPAIWVALVDVSYAGFVRGRATVDATLRAGDAYSGELVSATAAAQVKLKRARQ
jgi:hypothetical protein